MNAVLLSLSLPWAMHVPDGFVRAPWLAGGFALAGLLALLGAYKIRDEEIPRIALLSAAFFVASLMHLPLGPASVHLLLSGLVGVVLGRRAPLAILIGLTLQAVLFNHGGLTTLGINACVQTLPALLAAWLFAAMRRLPPLFQDNPSVLWLAGGLIGAASVLAAVGLEAVVLLFGGEQNWRPIIQLMFLAHLPVAAVEGVVLGCTVSFLARVKPEMLGLTVPVKQAPARTDCVAARSESHSPALLLLATLWVLFTTNSAQAHRLDAGYKVLPDRLVRIEAWFDLGGAAPNGASVKVLRPDQSLLAEGQLDDDGCFTFRFSQAEPLEVTISAGDGHGKTFTIPAEQLGSPQKPFHVIDAAAVWREHLKEALIGISFFFSLAALLLSWRNSRRLRALSQNSEAIANAGFYRKE
jgi:cobalt/nickel transport system permease protein